MIVRLNITMDRDLYVRLKKELPAKKISAFIAETVRARLRPNRRALEAGYKAARKEAWRATLAQDWASTETEAWPRE